MIIKNYFEKEQNPYIIIYYKEREKKSIAYM